MTLSRYYADNFIQSIYCYPDTDVLINKLDIRDPELLKQAETELTQLRLYKLYREPLTGKFSIAHLKNIHKYIFQDIYNFAGKLREETIIKDTTRFCESQFIMENLNICLSSLKDENFLTGLNIKDFSARVAYYMAELNVIHPFREGNGRTLREFIRCLGLYNNYVINWCAVDKDLLLSASIASVKDISKLISCIESCIEHV